MFKIKKRSLQSSRCMRKTHSGGKAVKILAGVGAGVGTVLIAFAMTWLISL